MLIADNKSDLKQYSVPVFLFKSLMALSFVAVGFITYVGLDYVELIELRKTYRGVVSENRHLKGEARVLMSNLEEAKEGLIRVEDYANRLDELVSLKINKISKKKY